MTNEKALKRARELVGQFHNGNRKDVAEALSQLPMKVTLYVGILMEEQSRFDSYDQGVLATLLDLYEVPEEGPHGQ